MIFTLFFSEFESWFEISAILCKIKDFISFILLH